MHPTSLKENTDMKTKEGSHPAARWVSYRPEIKVLDCTIRDGGLMNDHVFDDKIVKAVYQTCIEAGIDYMEMGYKNAKRIFSPDQYGGWKHCDEDHIRRIAGENDSPLKLSVMADAEKSDYKTDILPKEQSVLDMIRVATYIHQIPAALDMLKDAHDKGYETTVNLMAISIVQERELDEGLEILAQSEAKAIYLVDSFGHLYSEQAQYLLRKYLQFAKQTDKEVGVHMHNNMMLAYANTIEGIIMGANYLDATMAGMGRGAGNCPMECLLGFLHNPKYKIRPVLQCVQRHLEPMRQEVKWGFDLPYLITGLLNRHPRSAMRFNESKEKGDIAEFYDQIIEGE